MPEGNGWQRGAYGARAGKTVRQLVVLLAGDGLALAAATTRSGGVRAESESARTAKPLRNAPWGMTTMINVAMAPSDRCTPPASSTMSFSVRMTLWIAKLSHSRDSYTL